MSAYLMGREVYVKDAYACADPDVPHEYPRGGRISRPAQCSLVTCSCDLPRRNLETFEPEWHIICAPGFHADRAKDGTRQHNFAVINFSKKMILIGGTGYTGEIKKGIFTVLNYVLPQERKVLSMHCSANIGKDDDTAVFFGLSGTG